MTLLLRSTKVFRLFSLSAILLCTGFSMLAQDLYLGANSEFYLSKDAVFTTSNTVVNADENATFSMEAGTSWGSAQEFIDGTVTVYGNGETTLPVGNSGVYAPVKMTHSGNSTARYMNAQPADGSNGTDVDAVGTTEYWELSGTAVITLPWNENSGITDLVNNNGGALSAVSIVGLNSGVWDLISASRSFTVSGDLLNGEVSSDPDNAVNLDGFGQYTFGIDRQIVLALDDLFLTTGIELVSNPVKSENSQIEFVASGEMVDLKASIYDLNGRLIRRYDDIKLYTGQGSLSKTNMKSGLYFVKFEHEGKVGVKKLLIE